MKKSLIAIAVCAIALTTTIAYANVDQGQQADLLLQKASTMSDDDFFNALRRSADSMSASGVASGTSDEQTAEDSFMVYATSFMQRRADFSNEQIVSIATNAQENDDLRILAVQVFGQKNNNSLDDASLLAMLQSPESPEPLKASVLVNCGFTSPQGVQILKDMTASSTGVVAYHALKKLSEVDMAQASIIVDSVLSDYANYDERLMCSAIQIRSRQLSTPARMNDMSAKNEFIDLCLLIHSQFSDQVTKDTAIFALYPLQSEIAMTRVIEDESIDRILKVGAIDQNSDVLMNMLTTEPTTQEVTLVSKAMLIFPISEFYQPLDESRTMLKASFSSSDIVDEALAKISTEGIESRAQRSKGN